MTKTIEHVSISEIEEVLGRPINNQHPQPLNLSQKNSKAYVERLSDQEIVDFFKPFGFIAMIRENFNGFPAIEVVCEDFDVGFNDYDVAVNLDFAGTSSNPNNPFDFEAFEDYCNSIDTTPEQAIAEIIRIRLLGQRFHSYGKNYETKKQEQRKNSFSTLPKSMQKLFSEVNEKREAEITATANKLAYGTYQPEQATTNMDI